MRQRDIIDVNNAARPFHDEMCRNVASIRPTATNLTAVREHQEAILAHLYDHIERTPDTIFRQAFRASMANPAKSRAWKARALNLNPKDPSLAIALNGMAPVRSGESWMLGIAYPAPAPIGGGTDPIEAIILIDPKTGAASIDGDDTLIPARDPDRFTVHADARVWAREQATARLEWFYMRDQARAMSNAILPWNGEPESALAVGDIRKIRWPDATQITAGTGIDPKTLRSALFRQARIPHVEAPLQMGRAA